MPRRNGDHSACRKDQISGRDRCGTRFHELFRLFDAAIGKKADFTCRGGENAGDLLGAAKCFGIDCRFKRDFLLAGSDCSGNMSAVGRGLAFLWIPFRGSGNVPAAGWRYCRRKGARPGAGNQQCALFRQLFAGTARHHIAAAAEPIDLDADRSHCFWSHVRYFRIGDFLPGG